MQIRVIKSREDNPLGSKEAAAAIGALTFGYKLIPKAEAKNFEDYVEVVDDKGVRETVWVFNDLGAVVIAGETVKLATFLERFNDLEWCDANADSPIANIRHLHENHKLWRKFFSENKPMILMRRGDRVLKIRSDATEEDKNKWLKLL